jgi:hypothetical protein
MKINAVKFKDKESFDKNKSKSNVAAFYENHNVIVFRDNAYVKPNKAKVSHIEQIIKPEYGVPHGTAILKAINHHIGLAACERLKLKVKKNYPKTKTIVVEIPEHTTYESLYHTLISTGSFDYVEQSVITISRSNANFAYNDHWQLIALNAQEGWDTITQNPPPINNIVAVFDIGCETTHPDLVGQVIDTLDVVTNTTNVLPADGFANHGTPCTGLVVANATNNYGTIGVAGPYTKATFVNIGTMVDPQSFASSTDDKVQAINHAIDMPNCISISMSYGGSFPAQPEEDALIAAQTIGRNQKGILCCASSGNDNEFNSIQYPAYYQGVLSIGALEFNDFDYARAGYSNYGIQLFGSAPGSGTPATDRTGPFGYSSDDTTYFNGTSAACPVFAGAIAAIDAARPGLSANQIISILSESCIQVGPYNYNGNPLYPNRSYETGYGMINIANAVALALGGSVPPDPDIPINLRITASALSLTFPNTNITVIYTAILNKIAEANTTVSITIFKSANNTPALEPTDTVLTTVNITVPQGQYRYQGTYTFLVDNSWVGLNYIGVYGAALVGEIFTADNYAFRTLQVIGETPPPNLNLKARIQNIKLNEDGTKVSVYFDIENTGNTPVTKFTIKKGFVGYEEYTYEIAYDLTLGKFYVEDTFWELLPPPNFIFSTPFRVEVTSVNGIFPDDVTPDNISTALVIPVIGQP